MTPGRWLLLALPLLLSSPAAAQTGFDRNRDQGLGAMAGLASGAGVSYMEILPSAIGYRGTLLAWKYGDGSFVDAGVSGLKILSDDGQRRMYLVASASWWRRSSEETEEVFDDDGNVVETREVDDVDTSVGLGAGFGVELPAGERMGLTLEALFTYWSDSGDLLPLPQIGLHYHF